MPARPIVVLLLLLLCCQLSAASVKTAGTRLERFEAQVVSLRRLGEGDLARSLRCDNDPRFLLELRHADGSLHRYAIHSPARTFMGRARVGSSHRFVLLRYDDRERCYLYRQGGSGPSGGS